MRHCDNGRDNVTVWSQANEVLKSQKSKVNCHKTITDSYISHIIMCSFYSSLKTQEIINS